MNVSAVILSPAPIERTIPGVTVINHVSRFNDAAGLLAARLDALGRVRTEWFFFLDSDDELPAAYLRVLERCIATGAAVAYTDEWVTLADGTGYRHRGALYSQDAHIANQMLIHNLAVCRTSLARQAAGRVPRGTYSESVLFFELAKSGAEYIDEIGYIWHRRNGLNRHPSATIAQVRSAIWAQRNRTWQCI